MKTGPGNRGNALLVLALCFLLSGVLRTGEVIAALPERHGAVGGAGAAAGPEAAQAAGPDHPAAVGALVSELRQRRAALAEREAKLEARAQMLDLVEARLRARLAELETVQRKLESTAALVDDAAGKDVRHLAAMYEQMKPKQAGQLFDAMDPAFAAGFLGAMNAPAAALIMANMDAGKAYSVSLLLAGRNVDRK